MVQPSIVALMLFLPENQWSHVWSAPENAAAGPPLQDNHHLFRKERRIEVIHFLQRHPSGWHSHWRSQPVIVTEAGNSSRRWSKEWSQSTGGARGSGICGATSNRRSD